MITVENMGPAPVRSPGERALSPARAKVLEWLQEQPDPITVDQAAEALALHSNTAREHLAGLTASGLAVPGTPLPAGRGRPAKRYLAAPQLQEPDRRVRDYAGLAAALAGQLAMTSTDAIGDARRAGQAWGRALAAASADAPSGSSAPAARRAVVDMLAELGYDPAPDARCTSAALRRCPLLDVARQYPRVVCEVHLGMVRGMLASLGGDPSRAHLHPFAEPGACRLTLLGVRAAG